jgi:hypothetical protein
MDAESYSVTEGFVAFGRQYKPGEVLHESDLASWSVAGAEQEQMIAELLRRDRIEPVKAQPPAEPSPSPAHPAEPAPAGHEPMEPSA